MGDVDVMFYYTSEVAMPEGYEPYTRLPADFDENVKLYEIRDSQFPGYVFLVLSYLLRRRGSDDCYDSIECSLQRGPLNNGPYVDGTDVHGPASLYTLCLNIQKVTGMETVYQADSVKCIRSLDWPHQAADWPTRYRKYSLPDPATIDDVVGNGCDVVPVAHRQCRDSEWMSRHQWRLSFSRAEVVLLNNWTPVQQTVYHMLRVFVKTERLAYSQTGTVDNYRIKTLMLWACELKRRSFWSVESSLFAICVYLLHRFSVWLADARCQHYFISKCNLFGHFTNNCFESQVAAGICRSTTEESLARWFVDNYVRKCASLCPDNTVLLIEHLQTKAKLQSVMSAIESWKWHLTFHEVARLMSSFMLLLQAFSNGVSAECTGHAVTFSDIMFSWIKSWQEIVDHDDKFLNAYFSSLFNIILAVIGSMHHIWYMRAFFESTLLCSLLAKFSTNGNCPDLEEINFIEIFRDILFSNFSQNGSKMWQRKATDFLKILSVKSHDPEEMDLAALAKVYLRKAIRCDHIDNDSVYYVANVYLAVLHYATGQYQTALDHCTLVTRSQHHSTNYSSRVVSGELLPKVDDNIDSALGLTVLYQYVRTAALNRREEMQHVSVFTTELFAHYFTIKCLLIARTLIAPVSLASSAAMSVKISLLEELDLYRRNVFESKLLFVGDLLLLKLPNNSYSSSGFQGSSADVEVLLANSTKLSELTKLLRQNSIESLMAFQRIHEQNFGPVLSSCFEPLNLYRCCLYEQCIQTCQEIVSVTIDSDDDYFTPMSITFTYADFIQLMDVELVSLMALAILVHPSVTHALHTITVSQLALSLYLMTQCHVILQRPLTSLLHVVDLIDASFRTVSSRRIFDEPILQLSGTLLVRTILSYDEVQKSSGTTRAPTQCHRHSHRKRQKRAVRTGLAFFLRSCLNLYDIIPKS